MEVSLEVRRDRFASFWRAELERAEGLGMTVPKIAKAAGIGSNTIYRWRDGGWPGMPKPDQIVAVCDILDIDPQIPMGILWPGKRTRAQTPQPRELPREVESLLRKLEDPEVPETEKYLIQETLRSLAARQVNRPNPS